jgi:methylmalonyl-CoA/ethylmalonyl-CoA epimerase
LKVDHIGIAVPNLADALAHWRPVLGDPVSAPELVPGQRVRVAFLGSGDTHVELVEPADPDSPVSKFLAARGSGVHHIAFAVPSVDDALRDVAARGGRLIDQRGRSGARGRTVGFAHPSAFAGVLVEFVEDHP